MKRYIILVILSNLVIFCQAQKFHITETGSHITVNVPFPLKAYTYNHFVLTDSSLIVCSPRQEIDLILRDPEQNRNIILSFPSATDPVPKIRTKDYYKLQTGENAVFTVCPSQDNILVSTHNISFYFIVDEFGNLQEAHSLPTGKTFCLSSGRTYGFRFTPENIGTTDLGISLYRDSLLIGQKEFTVSVTPSQIHLQTETEIEDKGMEKIIHYNILSSSEILDELELNLLIDVKINNLLETIKVEDIIFKKGTSVCSGEIRKKIKGRLPRSFSVNSSNLFLISDPDNATYSINE